jgi:hypothetical protein
MWLLSAAWTLIGIFDLIKAEFLPERFQSYTAMRLLGILSWRTWVIVFLILFIGVLLEGGHVAIQKRDKLPAAAANGPDVVLDWESTSKNWDKVRLRNIGKESAFNVTLDRFSWPELSFIVPVQVNVIHPNTPDMVIEPKFSEKTSGTSNIGCLNTVLRSPSYNSREPLEVTITFTDTNGTIFERNVVLEAGHGGDWGPEILVTLKELKRKQHG